VSNRPGSRTRTRVFSVDNGHSKTRSDYVATEEPLEIRLHAAGATATVAVTMRTPGSDFELAAGFLVAEGVIDHRDAVSKIRYCTDPGVDSEQQFNIVTVDLVADSPPDIRTLERHFHISSACGVCGKASLEALELRGFQRPPSGPVMDGSTLEQLPTKLRSAQGVFDATGGLHAAGLFSPEGDLLAVREDVGRHNAVDKLIGWALLQDLLPLHNNVLLVSGRSSFEIMQKALAAGIPFVSAVSAPSSLAVDLAREFGLTLVGFLRNSRFNVYAGESRLGGDRS
jgi:FdhD protein